MSRQYKDITSSEDKVVFDLLLAQMLGISSAILLTKIAHFCAYNEKNEKQAKKFGRSMERDGRVWTYSSQADLERYTTLNCRTIRRSLSELRELGLLHVTNEYAKELGFNNNWYAPDKDNIQFMFGLWERHGSPKRANAGRQSEEYQGFMDDWKDLLKDHNFTQKMVEEECKNLEDTVTAGEDTVTAGVEDTVTASHTEVEDTVSSLHSNKVSKYKNTNSERKVRKPNFKIFIPDRPKTMGGRPADQVVSSDDEEEEEALFKMIKAEWGSCTKQMRNILEWHPEKMDIETMEMIKDMNAIERFDEDKDFRLFVQEKIEYYTNRVKSESASKPAYHKRLAYAIREVDRDKFGFFDWRAEKRHEGNTQVSAKQEDVWIPARHPETMKVVSWRHIHTGEQIEGAEKPTD